MRLKDSIALFKEDQKRTNYGKCRFLYDPIIALLLSFRLSDCSIPLLKQLAKLNLKILSFITGIQFVSGTEMGGGIRIIHHGTIVITKGASIGKNLTLHQGVTIGKNFGGTKYGYPTIGDNVIIFPNSIIVGDIKIGSNVIIGAGSIVINDIPDNCVVAGNPAKVVSHEPRKAVSDREWSFYFKLPSSE